MKKTDIRKFQPETINKIFEEIPHIGLAIDSDPKQREFFLNSSKIFEAEPGEVIIKRGEYDHWVYFLLVGQLLVYPEFSDKKNNLVSYIAPGEMFGELAFIRELDRNATIIGDENSRKIFYLGTDFSSFGLIHDFSAVIISTKITFYKTAIKIVRKRLENLRIDFPDNELSLKSKQFRECSAEKGTMHELLYLQDQSKEYAKILCKWNRSLEIESNFHLTKGKIPVKLIEELMETTK
ncbi:MAG: cyclic nucleotide-binding domain-containing protein [Deltaproteobacteria bacterium]|jgi:CRP/FNR family transcriptional regulator, cyclic AMP receptor protein|nr:cyclic nucleotide-binding domain-containing protein [Deltaproteobacteria bacterium]